MTDACGIISLNAEEGSCPSGATGTLITVSDYNITENIYKVSQRRGFKKMNTLGNW